MGVNIAIDDFGTGHSSLGYLSRLPVNALKIDRSFIARMAEDADSMSIVSTIISLARSLNLKVVAEGVETEEQSRFLRLLKCDEIQGYLISKPLPASELETLLLNGLPATQAAGKQGADGIGTGTVS
jgi:EAL domain-containing protein (putative c-di-GMP-specific phosphodiesterase class I)